MLPFENLNKDDEGLFLVDGIVEDLISEFSMIKEVEIVSERTLEELFTFVWNGQKAEAMQGYNDDLVMSLCIALWVRDTALRFRSENIETQKSLFDYMGSTTNMDAGKNYRQNGLESNPYEMKNPRGGTESLDWLLQ